MTSSEDREVPTEGRSASHSGKRRALWLHLTIGAIGILLIAAKIVCEQIFEHLPPTGEFAVHLLGDVGIGFLVAVAVARVFDLAYHDHTILRPLQEVRHHVDGAKHDIDMLSGHIHTDLDRVKKTLLDLLNDVKGRDQDLDRQLKQLLRDAHMLQDARREGIVAIHRRGEQFRNAVREAVRASDKFFWTIGRTHKEMLVQNGDEKGWIIGEIENKLRNREQPYEVKIILANAFDKPQSTGKLPVPPANNAARDMLRNDVNGKQTTRGVLSIFDPLRGHDNIHLRLLRKYPIPHGAIITDRRMFVEHYLSTRAGGALTVLEIETKGLESELYYAYKSDFQATLQHAEGAACVLERYIARKNAELSVGASLDRDQEIEYLKKDRDAHRIACKWEGLDYSQATGAEHLLTT